MPDPMTPDTPPMPDGWDVYRDKDGNPVTISEDQMYALLHAVWVVERVREHEKAPSIWAHAHPIIELSKSRLLGRLLLDGRPPLMPKPAHFVGAVGYHLVEPDLHHYYLSGPTPLMVTVDRDTSTITHVFDPISEPEAYDADA